jgi:hypothetical protein
LSSFWFILKQQWAIEEISFFSYSSHLEWRTVLSDIFLKGIHSWIIPAMFGLIWFCGFRGKDLNVNWFSRFRGKDLNVIFYQNMPNLHN